MPSGGGGDDTGARRNACSSIWRQVTGGEGERTAGARAPTAHLTHAGDGLADPVARERRRRLCNLLRVVARRLAHLHRPGHLARRRVVLARCGGRSRHDRRGYPDGVSLGGAEPALSRRRRVLGQQRLATHVRQQAKEGVFHGPYARQIQDPEGRQQDGERLAPRVGVCGRFTLGQGRPPARRAPVPSSLVLVGIVVPGGAGDQSRQLERTSRRSPKPRMPSGRAHRQVRKEARNVQHCAVGAPDQPQRAEAKRVVAPRQGHE